MTPKIGNPNFTTAHHSILIGEGLSTNKPYHLLVDQNGIKIDKIMTKEEYELIHGIFVASCLSYCGPNKSSGDFRDDNRETQSEYFGKS